jgi:hypothetical protein
MAFKLRTPFYQEKDPMSGFKKPNPKIQKSLDKSSSKHPESKIAPKNGSNYEDVDPYGIGKSVVQLLDPTGISSYGDVKKTWNDGRTDWNDVVEPLGALPIIGKFGKIAKGVRTANRFIRTAETADKANKVITGVNKASKFANQDKVVEAVGKTVLNQKKSPVKQNAFVYTPEGLGEDSPLMKQKLSPKAAKAKAERDLAYAKTPDRRKKKAEDQRRHRHDPSGKGKDWDHEDQHWESVHRNRGNDGNGTKKESGKHYKVS